MTDGPKCQPESTILQRFTTDESETKHQSLSFRNHSPSDEVYHPKKKFYQRYIQSTSTEKKEDSSISGGQISISFDCNESLLWPLPRMLTKLDIPKYAANKNSLEVTHTPYSSRNFPKIDPSSSREASATVQYENISDDEDSELVVSHQCDVTSRQSSLTPNNILSFPPEIQSCNPGTSTNFYFSDDKRSNASFLSDFNPTWSLINGDIPFNINLPKRGRPSSGRRVRRSRSFICDSQKKVLKHWFQTVTSYPNKSDKDMLGNIVGLRRRQVEVWFQNERRKLKIDNEQSTTDIDDGT